MNSCIFQIYFILYIYLSNTYLIFDLLCLTLSLANTHGIGKYARTHTRRYTHTHTYTYTQIVEKVGKQKGKKNRGGSGKKQRKEKRTKRNRGKKRGAKRREKGGGGENGGKRKQRRKRKKKREGGGLRGVEGRCSALQCVAVRCSALQCVAVRCRAHIQQRSSPMSSSILPHGFISIWLDKIGNLKVKSVYVLHLEFGSEWLSGSISVLMWGWIFLGRTRILSGCCGNGIIRR